MSAASKLCQSDPRYVGDPIDVITGANTDAPVDLLQRGPILFQWVRYYSSARSKVRCSLGWGQSHDFDRFLIRDLEGVRYEDPFGTATGFQDLDIDISETAGGKTLTRTGVQAYVIAVSGQPNEEFYFTEGNDVAKLARLRQGPHSIEFRYTEQGVLREITDSRGRRIRVSADAAGRLLGLTLDESNTGNPGQALLTYEYDRAGNLVRATDVFRTTLSFAYDAANRMIRRTDRRGYSFHFEYDELGRCIHSRGDDGYLEVFLDYQPDALVTLVRRGDGGQWVYHYDDRRCITEITDPYGNATKFTQDDSGRTVQEMDPNGNVTTLHYDDAGQHDYRIDPNGHVLPTKAENPTPPDPLAYRLPTTPLEWEFGRLVAATDIKPPTANDPLLGLFPAPVVNTVLGKTTTYDAAAGETAVVAETTLVDERGQALEASGPRCTERWKYDPNANLIEHQDRDGSVFRNTYKSWNALAEAIDPLSRAIAFDYDVQGQVAKVTDAGGTVVEYGYDWNEKLVEIRHQGQVRDRYRRDRAGNIVEKLDAQGRTLATWEFGAGNLEKVRMLGDGEKHTFEHDAQGRVTTATSPAGTATFSFDGLGRTLTDLRDGLGVAHEFDMDQIVGTKYFDKFEVAYATQDNGDVLVRDPTGAQHRFQRGVTGLIVKVLANGLRELSQFDVQGRCRRKAVLRAGQSSSWMRGYAYSAAGDLLAISDTNEGVTQYRYDATHRLTEESGGGKPRPYQFDAAGNLTLQPGLNEVTLDSGNRLKTANGDRFTYNDRDHIAAREGAAGKTRYEYDALDRLVKIDLKGEPWTASYDAFCRRVSKTWRGRTTTYYWDDFRLAAEVRHDGSVRLYVYADEIALVPFMFVEYASLDAEPASGSRYYLFTNQVGAPLRVEDEHGKACWTARLDPYGRAEIGKDSTLEMPLRFPGHYCDAETGLHFNRFRYFSPELGRFLQSDPLGQAGGINLYAYPVSPLIDVDLDGLTKTKVGPPPIPRRAGPQAGAPPPVCATCPRIPPGGLTPGELIRSGAIKLEGTDKEKAAIMKDLNKIAGTKTGQRVLSQIRNNHQADFKAVITIKVGEPARHTAVGGPPLITPGHTGWHQRDPKTGKPGQATDSEVNYTPGKNLSDTGKNGSPSDAVLLHELDHAQRAGSGNQRKDYPNPDATRFPNAEEHAATVTENAYRREQGLPERVNSKGEPDYYKPMP